MPLSRLVLHCIVRACMLCCRPWSWAGVAAKAVHSCAILTPFLGSSVQTTVQMISLRGLCVSGEECVLRLVLRARCHQHGLSTHQRLQPSTFFATRSGSICWPCSPCCLISTDTRSCGFVYQSRPGPGFSSCFSSCCMALVFGHAGHSRYCLGPEHATSLLLPS